MESQTIESNMQHLQKEAEEEWKEIEQHQEILKSETLENKLNPLIDYKEAKQYFLERDLTSEKENIIVIDNRNRSFIGNLLFHLFGKKLNSSLTEERDQVFALALVPFNNNDGIHFRVLQTIYASLTGSTDPPPRVGKHWEVIGFQGTNPATDLRGVGILGLIQLLFFSRNHQKIKVDMFRLSHDSQQVYLKNDPSSYFNPKHFPFCVVSLGITKLCLEVLREGKLFGFCNSKNSVFEAANELFCSSMLSFFLKWKKEKRTILDFATVQNNLSKSVKQDPHTHIKSLHKYNNNQSKKDSKEFT